MAAGLIVGTALGWLAHAATHTPQLHLALAVLVGATLGAAAGANYSIGQRRRRMDRIPLGALVKDRISQFTGTVSARAEYLDGATRYEVTPRVDLTNKLHDSEWFDERRLEVMSPDAAAIERQAQQQAETSER